METQDDSDAAVSPMEAQNTAQRHRGPAAEPRLATAAGGPGAGPDAADATQTARPSPIARGGESDVRDDR